MVFGDASKGVISSIDCVLCRMLDCAFTRETTTKRIRLTAMNRWIMSLAVKCLHVIYCVVNHQHDMNGGLLSDLDYAWKRDTKVHPLFDENREYCPAEEPNVAMLRKKNFESAHLND